MLAHIFLFVLAVKFQPSSRPTSLVIRVNRKSDE